MLSVLLKLLLPDELSILRHLTAWPDEVPLEQLRGTRLERVQQDGAIFTINDGRVRLASRALAEELSAALGEFSDRETSGAADLPARIMRAQISGDYCEALRLFERAGGAYFVDCYGRGLFHRVLRGFPARLSAETETLVLAHAMQALREGDLQRARHLLAEYLEEDEIDLGHVLSKRRRYSARFRLFALVLAVQLDALSDADLSPALYDLEAEFASADKLHRGVFHSALLALLTRRNEYGPAREMADRARLELLDAGAPLLTFCVDLNLAALDLKAGRPAGVVTHLRNAQQGLSRLPFETESEARMLRLLQVAAAAEHGDLQPMAEFIQGSFSAFIQGETWPLLAELAIRHGAQALACQIALPAARAYLEKWRVYCWRSKRFQFQIALQEVILLQNGQRWQEAATLLAAIPSNVTRACVEGADLERLSQPDDIDLACAWLRQLVWEDPNGPGRRDQLAALSRNGQVAARVRIGLLVLSAALARRQREMHRARAEFRQALELAAGLDSISAFLDESASLDLLLNDARIGQAVAHTGAVRPMLRKLAALPISASASGAAEKAGLTRQEIKVLALVVEGGSNKQIARQLGLAEVTVKFHLSNLYRKLGCHSRSEAAATARALSWVA
ncbi:response regulator transcription factor [Thioclava sp. BHET1]|nr:response regulator transcription factor [Thioclava sp. BHET1]